MDESGQASWINWKFRAKSNGIKQDFRNTYFITLSKSKLYSDLIFIATCASDLWSKLLAASFESSLKSQTASHKSSLKSKWSNLESSLKAWNCRLESTRVSSHWPEPTALPWTLMEKNSRRGEAQGGICRPSVSFLLFKHQVFFVEKFLQSAYAYR